MLDKDHGDAKNNGLCWKNKRVLILNFCVLSRCVNAIHHQTIVYGVPINRISVLYTRYHTRALRAFRNIALGLFYRNIRLFVYANAISPVNISKEW